MVQSHQQEILYHGKEEKNTVKTDEKELLETKGEEKSFPASTSTFGSGLPWVALDLHPTVQSRDYLSHRGALSTEATVIPLVQE